MYAVIVESRAKVRTISKYLSKDFMVMASYGHVRSIPSKSGSVVPEQDFAMHYTILSTATKHIQSIVQQVKAAQKVYLATDPDREGEAIAWHITEVLKVKEHINIPMLRISFNEITQKAVQYALQHPREIDDKLVNAQQARLALDYLVGFTLSPILWHKLPGSKSAGRVQSVALRLICEREKEIEVFRIQEYWTINTCFTTTTTEQLVATLTHLANKKLTKFAVTTREEAEKITTVLEEQSFMIKKVEKKFLYRQPLPPFITSTLQQEAFKQLHFTAKKTMLIAQKLYEGVSIDNELIGLITYMRTDGVHISDIAVESIRKFIRENFDIKYLVSETRKYSSKVKNAQEAHEAIRPTMIAEFTPAKVKQYLSEDENKLYELIWRRTLTTQMSCAEFTQVNVTIASDKEALLQASTTIMTFSGFYTVYREESMCENKTFPSVHENQECRLIQASPKQHFTQPPPRYSEASLIKTLESLGIGRPSTYASVIAVLQDRKYVCTESKHFLPVPRGRVVTVFLEKFFNKYVEYDFTAHMEEELDKISVGTAMWKEVLQNFWQEFAVYVQSAEKINTKQALEMLTDLLSEYLFKDRSKRTCPYCKNSNLILHTSKFGVFLGCLNYPTCTYVSDITDKDEHIAYPKTICITDKKEIALHKGPYGFYLKCRDVQSNKSKNYSIGKNYSPESIDLVLAEKLVSLPRLLGKYPKTKQAVKVGIGRFGEYILHNKKYTPLSESHDVFTITLEEAVSVLANTFDYKTLGIHPKGIEIVLHKGRYGFYLQWQNKKVSVPKDIDALDISLTKAIELLDKKTS